MLKKMMLLGISAMALIFSGCAHWADPTSPSLCQNQVEGQIASVRINSGNQIKIPNL